MKTFIRIASCLAVAGGLVIAAAAQDIITTVGSGGPNNLPAVNANLNQPFEVAVDSAGNVYVAASNQNQVFKISTAGVETVVAGTGFAGYGGDGGPAVKATLNFPWGVAVDTASPANVYISEHNNCLVRKVDQATGVITTVAGLVVPNSGHPYPQCGYSGLGGHANAAEIGNLGGLELNTTNNDLYIADYGNGTVLKVAGGAATDTISLVAGSGGSSSSGQDCQGGSPFGDGAAATDAFLCNPQAMALDTSVTPANVFISDGSRCAVREVVGSSGKIYLVAGSYSLGCGFTDSVNALKAQLNDPWQLHLSASGGTTTVQVADYNNARIRQFTLTYSAGVPEPGNITTIAGKGQGGWCNDDGQSVLKVCMNPVGLAYDASGNYYIGDYGTDRVSKVLKSDNFISTIMGWGADGGTQTNYSDPIGIKNSTGQPAMSNMNGVYVDPITNVLYIGDSYGASVYAYNIATGEISNFAGNGVQGFAGDGSAAASASTEVNLPIQSASDSEGNIYIADNNNCAIRKVTTNGDITTIAGGSSGSLKGCGYSGDGTAAVDAQLNAPNGVALDSSNNIYIADYNNCAIRKITASTGDITTIAGVQALGCGYSGDGGPANQAQIQHPQQVAVDGSGNVYFADQSNQQIREIVARTGYIQTVAGDQAAGYSGDGIALNNAINNPDGVTVDPNGNIFFSDTNNEILRWVTPSGTMITFAGTAPGGPVNPAGYSGDGGKALSAQLNEPLQITRDSNGNTYVADYNNGRVRGITAFPGYGMSSTSLIFNTQPTGTVSDFQAVTVSAVGPTTISGVTASTGFSEIDDCAGEALTANETCEVDVYFQPTTAGKIYGSITLTSNAFFATNPHIISVNGVGGGLKLTGSIAFGTVPLKTAVSNTLTLTASGTAVTLSKIYLTSTTYFSIKTGTGGSTCPVSGGALAANASCTIIVTYDPTVVGFDKSTLVVDSNDPASPLLASATGTGTEVKTSLSSIAFGSISYGTTSTIDLTISNTGTASFTLTPAVSGTGFAISSTGKTCTTSLAAGASCVLPVEYNPTTVGTNSGTLTLTTNGGSSPVLPLSGTATTDVSESPTSLAFGTIGHGTTKTLNVTVTNVGKIASLSVAAALSGTGAADFAVLSTGNTCTAGVAPGKSCTLPVEFKPAAADAYSATLTITTNGGANPTVTLTGTGD